jgi:hypothetical protein
MTPKYKTTKTGILTEDTYLLTVLFLRLPVTTPPAIYLVFVSNRHLLNTTSQTTKTSNFEVKNL